MANRTDTGAIVQKGAKPRRFPWRLWLYAVLMTGAAVAGGYFTWQYRGNASTERELAESCTTSKAKLETASAASTKDATDCKAALGGATLKQKQLETQLADISKNLNASKEELDQLRVQKTEADKRIAAIEEIRKQFVKMTDTGQLRVSARRGQLVLSLPSEVLFPTGSAELSKVGEYAVVEVGAVLKKFPGRRFLVVGHTDNQDFAKPKGDGSAATCAPKDNWALSTERALTVTRVLVTAGMNKDDLIPAGVGEHDPVASNATAEGRQKNRRIEIALLPAINELPPLPASLGDETAPKP
jgi:chemotaxis protein MotB